MLQYMTTSYEENNSSHNHTLTLFRRHFIVVVLEIILCEKLYKFLKILII